MIIGLHGIINKITNAINLVGNLFASWNADGTNNLTVKNAWNANGNATDSKNSNNGSIVTPSGNGFVSSTMTYGTGKIGSDCFQFSGSNFVTLPDNTLNFTSDFSVSCWVYLPSTAGTNIIMSFDNSSGASNYNGWQILCSGNNAYLYIYNSAGGIQSRQYSVRVPIPGINQWIHLVATKRVGQEGNIYVNGTLGTKTTSSGGGGFSTMDPTYISRAYIGAGYWFGASPAYTPSPSGLKIDAIQTWDGSALDQDAVTELYNSGNGQEYPFTLSNALIGTLKDSVSNNHGTQTSIGSMPTFTIGKIGKAFQFDGINDYVQLPTNAFNSITGDFSISGWVYIPFGYIGGNQINFICNLWAPGWAYNFKGFRLCTSGNSIVFQLADGSSYNGNSGIYTLVYNYDGAGFISGNWYYIVATRKSSVGSKIYLNGSLVASDTNTVNHINNTTMTPTIGNMLIPGVQNAYYAPNGSRIDAVSVWNKELSTTEITALYNSGNGIQLP